MRAVLFGAVCVWGAGSFLVACGTGSENATGGNSDATAEGSGDETGSGMDTGSGADGGSSQDASDSAVGAPADASPDSGAGAEGGKDSGVFACDGGPALPSDAALPPVHICSFGADGGNVFPLFDKCCVTNSDCAFGIYMYSCCGDTLALGFNKSQTAAFDAKVARWTCAACGCAGSGLHTEDGQQAVGDAGVRCDNGFCETFAR